MRWPREICDSRNRGLFSKQTPKLSCFGPGEEVGGVWLWSSYPVPAWRVLGQSKVNLTRRTVEPLTLDFRITGFPFTAHLSVDKLMENKRFNTRLSFGSHRSKWDRWRERTCARGSDARRSWGSPSVAAAEASPSMIAWLYHFRFVAGLAGG